MHLPQNLLILIGPKAMTLSKMTEVADEKSSDDEMKLMNEGIERLKQENKILRAEIRAKDEEKREVLSSLCPLAF